MRTSARPSREREQRDDLLGGALGEAVAARVGHRPRHVEERLLGEVVRRADDRLARVVEAEPPPDEARVLAGRQRRGDEDRGRPVLPQPLAQLARDVDRRPGERVRLRPDDALELARLEARLDLRRRRRARAARARRDPRPGRASALGEVAERVDEHERRLGGHLAQPPPARRPARPRAAAARPTARPGRAAARAAASAPRGRRARRRARAAAAPARETRPPSHDAADSSSRCASSKTTASCSGSTPPPDGDVREVERVVRDHEVGLAGAVARGLGEAGRDERAAAAGAAVAADGELGPERLRRLELQLGAVAGLGLVEPALHRLPGARVAPLGQQQRLEALQLPAADVVLAPLEHRDASPRARARAAAIGTSWCRSCSCSAFVAVATTTRCPDSSAGIRYARLFPTPVPASATRCSPVASACSTAPRERGLLRPRLVLGQGALERAAGAEDLLHLRPQRTRSNGCSPIHDDNPPRYRSET